MSESTKSPSALRWGVALATGLMALGLASGPALADGWRHDGGPPPGYGRGYDHERHGPEWRHEREWHRHYVPPPVIYYPPPPAYYAPPPVVMPAPGFTLVVPLQIR